MLDHYSDNGFYNMSKPFEEVKQMIREERNVFFRIKRLFKGIK